VRMRKEGLDLELVRFVEARQVGQNGVGNPYLVHAAAGSPPPPPPSMTQPMPPMNDSPWS